GGRSLVYYRQPQGCLPWLSIGPCGFAGVVRVVGGRPQRLFATNIDSSDSGVENLAVGDRLIGTARWRVLSRGDGCGCLDAPVWSPDGSKIAYLHVKAAYPFSIAVMNADGSGRHDITTGLGRPAWSPDGTKIAYDDSGGQIAVVNADGTGAVDLAQGF